MVPSEIGYLFLLAIGVLSFAMTVAVFVSAYRHRHERKSGPPHVGR